MVALKVGLLVLGGKLAIPEWAGWLVRGRRRVYYEIRSLLRFSGKR